MNEFPLVTVITVTYNSATYVRDAIESVLRQDYRNIEYIIGDDCSTDNTWETIKEYEDPRIKRYRNEVNLGEYPNRNKAIDRATGKYLIFIDGDDVIYPHGVENFVRFAEACPQAPLIIQKGYINNLIFPACIKPRELIINAHMGKLNLLSSSFASNFFHMATLKKIGKLSEHYRTGDDEVRLRMASRYPVLFIPGWLSWPRETPGQASSKLLHGIGLAETYQYTKLVYQGVDGIEGSVLQDIEKWLKRNLARQVIRNYVNGRRSINRQIFQMTGLNWKELRRHISYRAVSKDFLEDYTPSHPFKDEELKNEHVGQSQLYPA